MPGRNDDLRKAYRITAFIGLAMVASLIVYAVVVESIKRENAPFSGYAPLAPDVLSMLRYALLAVAAVEFPLIRIVNSLMLSGRIPLRSATASSPSSSAIQRLVSAAIVTFALCESVAVFGLVLFFIQGNSDDFYLFLAISLVFFGVSFPRYTKWEAWFAEQEREQARRPQA